MSPEAFREHLAAVAPDLPCDDEILLEQKSPLAEPIRAGALTIGNRWVIHPMEGWDGGTDGTAGELTVRRWRHFGESGAKLIWGGEAVAVRFDGRANPNQLVVDKSTLASLAMLRAELARAHRERFGGTDDLVVGLQLTHSGRYARPERKDLAEPRIAFRHPVLDDRVGVTGDDALFTDTELDSLVGDFVRGAVHARELGFDFVDVKHCHGYLLHELLGAKTRAGAYGGSFENRTRFLRQVVEGIRRDAPGLEIGVRVSAFDMIPFRPDPDQGAGGELGPGIPAEFPADSPYVYGFGVDENDPTRPALDEAERFLELARELGIAMVNVSGGSPYYNPHIQRPALYPPSDGYQPPEDPLVGVARQARVTRDLKRAAGDLFLVGSALSYLQDYLPHVSQALVREGWMDAVGLGRMVLSYWDMPADCSEKGALERRKICRTFSDCTTAPRNGLRSGCYPLDKFYAELPEGAELRAIKRGKS